MLFARVESGVLSALLLATHTSPHLTPHASLVPPISVWVAGCRGAAAVVCRGRQVLRGVDIVRPSQPYLCVCARAFYKQVLRDVDIVRPSKPYQPYVRKHKKKTLHQLDAVNRRRTRQEAAAAAAAGGGQEGKGAVEEVPALDLAPPAADVGVEADSQVVFKFVRSNSE